MLRTITEHTIEDSLITQGGWSIDFGCGVDFSFSKGLLDYGTNVIGVDPNPLITKPFESNNFHYFPYALCSENTDSIEMSIFNDIDAASIVSTKQDVGFVKKQGVKQVSGRNLSFYQELFNIEQFEVIKLDIEGAEYDFLMRLSGPVAKQISVEFHDFRGMNPYFPDNERYYKEVFSRLSRWYNIVQHEKKMHPGFHNSANYWDSLLILK